AILICSSSAKTQYSGVTPKRPDATCLIRELRSIGRPFVRYRAGSSPPSPVLLFPPSRFIAIAIVSCASAAMEPCDMAPVENLRRIAVAGSTSLRGTAGPAGRIASRSLGYVGGRSLNTLGKPSEEGET